MILEDSRERPIEERRCRIEMSSSEAGNPKSNTAWTERWENQAASVLSGLTGDDRSTAQSVLERMRRGDRSSLSTARTLADEHSRGWRQVARRAKTFGELPHLSNAVRSWWQLFELGCEVFAGDLSRVARASFVVDGNSFLGAHLAAANCFSSRSEQAADALAFWIEPECHYEAVALERLAEGRELDSYQKRITGMIDAMNRSAELFGSTLRPAGVDPARSRDAGEARPGENSTEAIPASAGGIEWSSIPGTLQEVVREVLKAMPHAGTKFSVLMLVAGDADESAMRKKLDQLHEIGWLQKDKGRRSPYSWIAVPRGMPDQ